MNPQTYSVYLSVLTVSMLTPGPAMLQALTMGMRHGPKPVTAVALGNVFASVLQVAAALFGLSLLAREPLLLRLAGLAGAAYLAFLGLKAWRASGRLHLASDHDAVAPLSLASLFMQGAFVAAVNPKAWGFLAALLPRFAAGGMPGLATMALIAAPIAVLAFGGMMAYAAFGAFMMRLLTSPRAVRRFFRIMAVTLWLCAGYLIGG
ncbi:MAG: LysE family translocator [Solidesulfovibrio sp.]